MNRTRTSTLNAFGLRDQRNRIFPALSASDGSTLDLDFTTMGGVLDSRFTFTRPGPNATYINSLGYVTTAPSNVTYNTAWIDSNTTPTSWSFYDGAGTPAVVTIPSSGKRSIAITAGTQSFLYQAPPALIIGLRYSISIVLHSVTGAAPNFSNLISVDSTSGPYVYYKDGSLSSSGFTVTAGTYTILFTATASSAQIRIGSASGTAPGTYTIVVSSVQLQIGEAVSPTFLPNYSNGARYYGPRFDYNPTTLAPKGLLIEDTSTNFALYSESFVTSAGVYNDNAILSRTTTETSPSGGTAVCFFPTIALDYHRLQYSSVPVLSGAVTISIWLKRKDSNYRGGINAGGYINASAVFDLNGAGSVVTLGGTAANKAATITAYPNDWYRVTLTGTYTAGNSFYTFMTSSTSTDSTGQNFTGVASQGLIMWGMQVELGSGASSYIPTYSATSYRAAETCTFAVTPANISLTSAPPATFVYTANVHAIPTSGFPTIIGFQDSVGTTRVFRSQINSTTSNYVTWLPTGIASTEANEIAFSTLAQGVSFKLASSITSTFVTASRNGVAATAVSVGATYSFVTPEKIVIGLLTGSVGFTIANFKFFPIAKSQTELNALTT